MAAEEDEEEDGAEEDGDDEDEEGATVCDGLMGKRCTIFRLSIEKKAKEQLTSKKVHLEQRSWKG